MKRRHYDSKIFCDHRTVQHWSLVNVLRAQLNSHGTETSNQQLLVHDWRYSVVQTVALAFSTTTLTHNQYWYLLCRRESERNAVNDGATPVVERCIISLDYFFDVIETCSLQQPIIISIHSAVLFCFMFRSRSRPCVYIGGEDVQVSLRTTPKLKRHHVPRPSRARAQRRPFLERVSVPELVWLRSALKAVKEVAGPE